jgi:hypothetical protein
MNIRVKKFAKSLRVCFEEPGNLKVIEVFYIRIFMMISN